MICGLYMPMDSLGLGAWPQIYFWTFMALNFFVLLNVLLGILVEAYDKSKEDVNEPTQPDPIKFMIADWCCNPVGGKWHLSDKALEHALRDPKVNKRDGSIIAPKMKSW